MTDGARFNACKPAGRRFSSSKLALHRSSFIIHRSSFAAQLAAAHRLQLSFSLERSAPYVALGLSP
jgi:hypothetical protein